MRRMDRASQSSGLITCWKRNKRMEGDDPHPNTDSGPVDKDYISKGLLLMLHVTIYVTTNRPPLTEVVTESKRTKKNPKK